MTTKTDLLFDEVHSAVDRYFDEDLKDPIMSDVIYDIMAEFIDRMDESSLQETRQRYVDENENYHTKEQAKNEALKDLNSWPL